MKGFITMVGEIERTAKSSKRTEKDKFHRSNFNLILLFNSTSAKTQDIICRSNRNSFSENAFNIMKFTFCLNSQTNFYYHNQTQNSHMNSDLLSECQAITSKDFLMVLHLNCLLSSHMSQWADTGVCFSKAKTIQ